MEGEDPYSCLSDLILASLLITKIAAQIGSGASMSRVSGVIRLLSLLALI